MELQAWMKLNRYRDRSFIEAVNVVLIERNERAYTWRAVAPWRTGACIPRPPVVNAIATVTGNQVTYQDHVETNRAALPDRKRKPKAA